MEKEQILSNLNEKLGQTSLSERTISDYINENLPAEGTEPDEAYWNKHTAILKSLNGNFSKDVAAQVEDFKKNYKPSPAEPPKPEPQPNKELEELRKTVTDLTKRLDEKESQQTQEQLMAKVKSEMKKQGATDDYVLKQTLRGVTLDAKKSVEDLAKEMLAAYDSEYKACRGKGAAPRNSGGQGGAGEKPFGGYFAKKWANEKRGENSK